MMRFKAWLEVIDPYEPTNPTNPERYPWNRKGQDGEEKDPRELNNPMKHGPGNENPTNAFQTYSLPKKGERIPPAKMRKN